MPAELIFLLKVLGWGTLASIPGIAIGFWLQKYAHGPNLWVLTTGICMLWALIGQIWYKNLDWSANLLLGTFVAIIVIVGAYRLGPWADDEDEYAETIDFPVRCSVGAPMPLLLASDYRQYLIFHTNGPNRDDPTRDELAVVEFSGCLSVKLGTPNDEVLKGHRLHKHGLEPYSVQIVRNSRWLKELHKINKVHPHYDWDLFPVVWAALNHYVFWFHDSTFECAAESYEVQVVREPLEEVVAGVSKRLTSYGEAA